MDILSNEHETDVISWLPHGKAFIIYKKKSFASQVLPKYFKATKFTSFTRKLNRWGFTRVTRGPEMGSYYHKFFVRDDPSLCLRMSSHSNNNSSKDGMGHQFQQKFAMGMPGMTPFGQPGAPGMTPWMMPPGMNPMQMNPMMSMNPMMAMPNPMMNANPAMGNQGMQYPQQQLQQPQQQQQMMQAPGTIHQK